MKINILLFGLMTGILAVEAISKDSDSFDVPNGQVRTLSSGALVPGTLVSCELSVDEVESGSLWSQREW